MEHPNPLVRIMSVVLGMVGLLVTYSLYTTPPSHAMARPVIRQPATSLMHHEDLPPAILRLGVQLSLQLGQESPVLTEPAPTPPRRALRLPSILTQHADALETLATLAYLGHQQDWPRFFDTIDALSSRP